MQSAIKRVWEVDFLRGFATILMIIFHIVFDLKELYNYPTNYESGIFFYVGKAAAILFILIAGVSCYFSGNNVKRGIKVFSIGMLITIVTYLFMNDLTIKFGILHFLGICMMLYPLIKNINRYLLFIIGTSVIITGYFISKIIMPFDYLFPLGFISASFTSGDYYPIFPWAGLFMYGVVLGNVLYSDKKSLFKFEVKNNPIIFVGKHTLLIYVIHQPVIIFLLNILFKRSLF